MVESDLGGGVSSGDGADESTDDGDPEVTEISRRFERTGDTLDAIQQLEQLIVRRTGQIPVVTPEMLAAAAAAKREAAERDETVPPPLLQPPATVENPVVETPAAEPQAPAAADEPVEASVDFDIPTPVELDPAPTFSPWVDPAQVAAAQAARAQPEYADVSTAVFTLFSADRAEPEPELELEHVLPPVAEPDALAPGPESGIPVPLPAHHDEDEGLDHDVVDDPHDVEQQAVPELVPVRAVVAVPEPAPQPKKRRRFWPFGRH